MTGRSGISSVCKGSCTPSVQIEQDTIIDNAIKIILQNSKTASMFINAFFMTEFFVIELMIKCEFYTFYLSFKSLSARV